MRYEYRCLKHPDQREVIYRSMQEDKGWTFGICAECSAPLELDMGTGDLNRSHFVLTYGRDTGVYDYDYGKRATWDLTAPGKMEYCKKEGIIKDPFDGGPAPVQDWGNDPRNEGIA